MRTVLNNEELSPREAAKALQFTFSENAQLTVLPLLIGEHSNDCTHVDLYLTEGNFGPRDPFPLNDSTKLQIRGRENVQTFLVYLKDYFSINILDSHKLKRIKEELNIR